MRYKILQAVRDGGLLDAWDSLSFAKDRLRSARANRRFMKANPGFMPPPADLAFDAYNNTRLDDYASLGRRQAEGFASLLKQHLDLSGGGTARLLEWGCGPARLIRHMPQLFAEEGLEVHGTDYNDRTIAWCKTAIPDVQFALNGLNPPLPYEDGFFDGSYNFSVVTHLSRDVQLAWMSELHRVLKQGGVLLATTHGKNFEHLVVSDEEKDRYASGEIVVQSGYEEGKKWFFAIHPERFVKDELLKDFSQVEKLDGSPWGITQDVWMARK